MIHVCHKRQEAELSHRVATLEDQCQAQATTGSGRNIVTDRTPKVDDNRSVGNTASSNIAIHWAPTTPPQQPVLQSAPGAELELEADMQVIWVTPGFRVKVVNKFTISKLAAAGEPIVISVGLSGAVTHVGALSDGAGVRFAHPTTTGPPCVRARVPGCLPVCFCVCCGVLGLTSPGTRDGRR